MVGGARGRFGDHDELDKLDELAETGVGREVEFSREMVGRLGYSRATEQLVAL